MFLIKRGTPGEKDLVAAIGQPLLAARPLRVGTQAAQAQQLLTHWFSHRRLLPVVSAGSGEGRTRLALDLARRLAGLGVRTLLVDGDLRAPRLHRAFGLEQGPSLADFLAGRDLRLAQCGENLALLAAGRAPADPLEPLASPRLRPLFCAAAARFGAIVIDTPAAHRGPDLQIFAAHAGGALVVARHHASAQGALARLGGSLRAAAARVVGILLRQD